jgi:hypothetical protein
MSFTALISKAYGISFEQVWNVKAGWGSRPDIYLDKAHEGGDDVTGLCFSADGNTLLSRSTDSTMKVST